MSILVITSQNEFEEKVLQSGKPVLVDFWAPWCGPCRMVGPEVEAVAQSYADKVLVAKVNIDEQQGLAAKFNVMAVPTLLVLKDGREVSRLVGYRPRKDLAAAIDAAL